jgi:hypothetical protein
MPFRKLKPIYKILKDEAEFNKRCFCFYIFATEKIHAYQVAAGEKKI